MTFSVFVPPAATPEAPAPCIFYLSGLTCTDENFVQKAGAARAAAERGVALVAPDTSPRGAGVDGEDDAYDFGSGAGFYVDATAAPWRDNYNMYSYVTEELVAAVRDAAPAVDVGRRSITGHSMGGHGALTLAMKAPETWTSVSAFSPICNPTKVPWGKKAFEGYLGSVEAGAAHDASELVRKGGPFAFGDILISQGADDDFLVGDVDQLQPEAFRAACDSVGQGLELRYEAGYDHSYFFIATFIDQHVNFHADRLLAR
jgi:S-formylglutathione hydrolase